MLTFYSFVKSCEKLGVACVADSLRIGYSLYHDEELLAHIPLYLTADPSAVLVRVQGLLAGKRARREKEGVLWSHLIDEVKE